MPATPYSGSFSPKINSSNPVPKSGGSSNPTYNTPKGTGSAWQPPKPTPVEPPKPSVAPNYTNPAHTPKVPNTGAGSPVYNPSLHGQTPYGNPDYYKPNTADPPKPVANPAPGILSTTTPNPVNSAPKPISASPLGAAPIAAAPAAASPLLLLIPLVTIPLVVLGWTDPIEKDPPYAQAPPPQPKGFTFSPVNPGSSGYVQINLLQTGTAEKGDPAAPDGRRKIKWFAELILRTNNTVTGVYLNPEETFDTEALAYYGVSVKGPLGELGYEVISMQIRPPEQLDAYINDRKISNISVFPQNTPEPTAFPSVAPDPNDQPGVQPIGEDEPEPEPQKTPSTPYVPNRSPGTTGPLNEPVTPTVPGTTPANSPGNNPVNTPSSPGTAGSGTPGVTSQNTSTDSPTQEELEIPSTVTDKITELDQKVTDLTNRTTEEDSKKLTTCKFERTNLDGINAKLDEVLALLKKKETDKDDPDLYDSMPLPIAVKTGDRTGEVQTKVLLVKKGQSDLAQQFAVSAGFGLLGITGAWAKAAYELLGGGSIFNEQHQAQGNVKEAIEQSGKAQTQDEGATFNAVPIVGIAGLITAVAGAAWIRQGLHTLPRQVPNLALDPAQNVTTTATNAVDVTMTSTS
jgi:hypothetical protein